MRISDKARFVSWWKATRASISESNWYKIQNTGFEKKDFNVQIKIISYDN